jgi:hypothetical protein
MSDKTAAPMTREELCQEMLVSIGKAIEDIGDGLQTNGFTGLATKMEHLTKLRSAAYAVEEMRKL